MTRSRYVRDQDHKVATIILSLMAVLHRHLRSVDRARPPWIGAVSVSEALPGAGRGFAR